MERPVGPVHPTLQMGGLFTFLPSDPSIFDLPLPPSLSYQLSRDRWKNGTREATSR